MTDIEICRLDPGGIETAGSRSARADLEVAPEARPEGAAAIALTPSAISTGQKSRA